jgi:hypothetical protein
MKLSKEQLNYQNKCRSMLIGKTICSIIYGQANYSDNDAEAHDDSAPDYLTDHLDIDSLDGFLYLRSEKKAYRFCWLLNHLDFGVQIDEIGLSKIANEYEYQFNVSNEDKWKPLMNQKITDLIIRWDKSWSINLLNTKPFDIVFPHTYLLKTENGKHIAIITSIFDNDDIKPFVDRLIITTNIPLATELGLLKE